ncbi:hypothetical protein N7474_008317 [Penicillium riverlandense]|uniref:uncharacterized protein n=1 Tax=Penicillium riverlandense TaxID=1903569 RepID=UPI00254776DD|nr:uncharacterized protein N7474_008317 [Penicillium riverlandense]KAJ5812016.1 hypothetical protein N7474_008317 [Penicillium riverlandense]
MPPNTPLWSHPDPSSTQVFAFLTFVNKSYNLNLSTYTDLHQWSTTDIPSFAQAIWDFCGIKCSVPPETQGTGLDKMWPPPAWFPKAKLNYTENLLDLGLSSKPDAIAVTAYSEIDAQTRQLTFRELEDGVARWAHALRNLGVGVGDRVGVVLPNSVDTLVILLACAAIGAIFSSTAPDMGMDGIVERYRQLRPKVFICVTEGVYGGKSYDFSEKMAKVHRTLQEQVPELQKSVVVRGQLFKGSNVVSVKDILPRARPELRYEQLPFDHPLYVLYSSGTTGPPKCICHAAGRVLLQHKKEHMLQNDISSDSVFYQFTTTGWMMWNHLVSALACGTRIVLYDGSPLHPTPSSQLALVEREKVTNWGTSPKFLATLKASGISVSFPLDSLKSVNATGSNLSSELAGWFYQTFPSRIALFSGSGGTDLVGGLVMPSPLSTIYAGEIAGAPLGIKVEVWDETGTNVENTGADGELVVTRPFFSMPLTFWGANGNETYRKSYFDQFPGVWCHGDYIRKNPATGGYEVLGRSDGVLNPGGVRFGSAEIYTVVERFPEIQESIAVGQRLPDTQDEQVLLFVVLHKGKLSAELRDAIAKAIRVGLSPRHVPSHIIQVSDLPYTTNGKKIEKLVRDVVCGKKVVPSAAVANPEVLKEFEQYEKLRHVRARI